MKTLCPGIHAGISFADYLDVDGVNHTKLHAFRRTPAHAHWAMTHPEEDTDSLRVGDAVHVAVLEPERFEREYVKAPKFNKRTNAGKADAAQWVKDHPTQAALLPEEWDLAVALRDAVRANPIARQILSGVGHNELTAIWKDPTTSLICKGRIDRLTTYRDYSTVVDIKTARDAGRRAFAKAVYDYGYNSQAAYYLDGLNILSPRSRRFFHIVAEKEPPYCVALYELDPPAIEEGRRRYRRALDQFAECQMTGVWPGYPADVDALDIPKWSYEFVDPSQV